jgi:ribosomal protein S20
LLARVPDVTTLLVLERRSATLARTPRKWQGARNPSGLKRVRQAERRRAILQPRRSAAKTLVAKAVTVSTTQSDADASAVALSEAISALDRAAKTGAIHPNAAARRKSRLVLKVNAALGGTAATGTGHVTKTTGKAAAAKAAKARIAAGKAVKAKGAQTAAGKARAALSRTTRAEGTHGTAAATAAPAAEAPAPAKTAAKATTAKASTTAKAPAKSTAKASTTKATASKATRAAAEKAPAKTTRAKKAE